MNDKILPPSPETSLGWILEPIAYVCEADIRALANKPDGTDMSIAPRPFPKYGMKFPLYAARSPISLRVPDAEDGLVPISQYGAPSPKPTKPSLRNAADAYVVEKGIEHSGGIVEAAFEAGARWAGHFITKPKTAYPDCGRKKAQNADDAAAGMCPKWWAIRDADAERDCERAKP